MSKRSTKAVIGVVAGLLIIGAIAYFSFAAPQNAPATTEPTVAENGIDMNAEKPEWVKEALVDRVMGNPSAAITMVDHSSLTCPHCASFHTDILPKLKEEYIDTGKVKLVFTDFPLNMPAMQASALARCIKDNDTYFAYIDQLFKTQGQWATSGDARSNLLGTIKFTGLTRDEAAKCIDNPALAAGLLEKVDAAQKSNDVQSTPTFVFNGSTVVRGAEGYDVFKSTIDGLLN